MKILVLISVLICGCDTSDLTRDDIESKIVYIKDSRTNICFATFWVRKGYGGPVMSTVPCSAEVEKLLRGPNLGWQ